MRTAIGIAAGALLLGFAPVAAQLDDARAVRVDSILAAAYEPDGPGAAVAIVRDGRVILEHSRGRAHLEYDVPISPGTVFHVASVSKQFTTFAIALLAQQGRLSLDDDIRTHLPELHAFDHTVTIRHLIHHTSGIRDQWELLMMAGWRIDDVITRDQIMAMMLRQRELNFEPGSEYLYSNMGYSLLAEIVERVSGTTFAAFLHEHVFEPVGMAHTHVHNDHERIVPNRAYSYRPGQGGAGWRNAVLSYANQGATSLFTTAGDLARWLHNFDTGSVGGPALIAQMRERAILTGGDTIPYAFAVQRGQHRGTTYWGHGGADAGFRSFVMHFPEERLGIVVLSNAATTNSTALALAIADVYLPAGPAAEPIAATTATATAAAAAPSVTTQAPAPWRPSPTEVQQYTGDYYSPELATVYTVELRGADLFFRHARLGANPMIGAADEDVFRAGGRQIRFERDAAGSISGLRLSGSRVRNIAFVRLSAGALPH
jgi:CubicO group peptidase (beta-lactamase class C family)